MSKLHSNPDHEVPMKACISDIQRWGVIVLALFLLIPSVEALADDPEPLPALQTGTPATSTSLKRFPQNLGGNFLALFSKKNTLPLLIGGAASGIVAPFEDEIKDRLGVHGESHTIGEVGNVMEGAALVIPTVTGLLIGGHCSKKRPVPLFHILSGSRDSH